MSNINLDASSRNTILSLQNVSQLFNTTQNQLTSGLKVVSAADNAQAFFQSQSLSQRASDLLTRKSNTDQSVQSLQAALTATSAVTTLLQQLQAVEQGARGASLNERIADTQQFKDIGKQLSQLVKDASFQGLNLLTSTSSSLSTQFSERTAATFNIQGYNLVATSTNNGRTLFTQAAVFNSDGSMKFSALVGNSDLSVRVGGFSSLDLTGTQAGQGTVPASIANAIFSATDNRISNAISQLRAISSALGTNVTILQDRSNFTSAYSNSLDTASSALTAADLNTAAADSQALQLRQQFGIQALVSANTQNQSVLTLLRG